MNERSSLVNLVMPLLFISIICSGKFTFALESIIFHVDGATGDNDNDGLKRETAFETIQFAIEAASNGDMVLVWPGVYNEVATNGINFMGKAITVKSAADAAVLEVPGFIAVTFVQGEGSKSVFSNFIVRGSLTAILAFFSNPTICNVTVVDNDNGIIADNANPLISNSIFWNNNNGDLFACTAKYSYIQEEFENSLVAYWKFDESAGDVLDSVGDKNGTINGAVQMPSGGQIDGTLEFDGVNDYVVIDSYKGILGSNSRTITAWIKALPQGEGCIVHWGMHGVGKFDFMLNNAAWCGNVGSFRVSVDNYVGGVLDDGRIVGTRDLRDNKWHHVAAVVFDDGSPSINEVKIYVDGIPEPATYLGDCAINTISDGDVMIGAYPDPANFGNVVIPFGGSIDDLRIYGIALSEAEIKLIYEKGLAGQGYFKPGFVDAANGDYHLLSERGRYRASSDEWILDNWTSPCVDAGDPNILPIQEKMPNGGRINIGAYGGTQYASMSEWSLEGDLDQDGIVDINDFAIFTRSWLKTEQWKD